MILLCTFWRKVSFFLSHNKYNISKHCLHVLYVYRCWWMESIPEPSPGPMRSPAPSCRGNITLSIYLPAPEHWRQRQIHSLMAKNKLITAQQYRFLYSSSASATQNRNLFIPLLCLHWKLSFREWNKNKFESKRHPRKLKKQAEKWGVKTHFCIILTTSAPIV